MGAILDYIMSSVIFGVLVLTVARVQTNINQTMYQNTFSVMTQGNAVELARQIEFDFLKIGHHVRGTRILSAYGDSVTFRADLRNNMDTSILKYARTPVSAMSFTRNPSDFALIRTRGSAGVQQNWGLTYFNIRYYDSNMVRMQPPITNSDSLYKIRGILVRFTITAPEPVLTAANETTWSQISWEKLMFPRNLYQISLTK